MATSHCDCPINFQRKCFMPVQYCSKAVIYLRNGIQKVDGKVWISFVLLEFLFYLPFLALIDQCLIKNVRNPFAFRNSPFFPAS